MSLGIARTYAGGLNQHNLPATPSTTADGTLVTASGTIHTKGAYAQLIASTTYDWHGFWLITGGVAIAASATDMLLDIAIGAAASEQVILPDLLVGYTAATSVGPRQWFIPIFIPRGSRIAARIQALIASDTTQVTVHGVSGNSGLPSPLFRGADAYGIVSATSRGTSHTPGNSGAESTDANIGVTTTKNYGAVMIGVGQQTTAITAIAYHWELTIGGITRAEWRTVNSTAEVIYGPYPGCPTTVSVPIGTQLQVQAEASGTAQAHNVAFYCFY